MERSEALGPAFLKIDGLALWIHGRQFPDANDFYDGNWLNVTAHCAAAGASVWVQGAILMVPDLALWAEQCDALYKSLSDEAVLSSFEPELRVTIRGSDTKGHLSMRVDITPDHMSQSHRFDFQIDQTYLPAVIRDCQAIVAAYPIREVERWRRV